MLGGQGVRDLGFHRCCSILTRMPGCFWMRLLDERKIGPPVPGCMKGSLSRRNCNRTYKQANQVPDDMCEVPGRKCIHERASPRQRIQSLALQAQKYRWRPTRILKSMRTCAAASNLLDHKPASQKVRMTACVALSSFRLYNSS